SAPPPASAISAAAEAPADARRFTVLFTPSPALAARGVTVDVVRARLTEAGRIVDAVPRIAEGGAIRFEFTLQDVTDASVFPQWAEDGIVVAAEAPAVLPAPAPAPTPAPAALTSSHF